ncbi:MAG: hypothetical protein M3370_01135 [Actinomycetota bacterium]|nr:hypothetical protein [Actinomycetota bacterium]
MFHLKHPFAAAAVAAAALALPASAAAHSDPSLGSVRAHTERADKHLDRALSQLEANRDRAAERSYDRARLELRRGEADAKRLRRAADTGVERSSAARAYWAVGDQADENIEVLVEILDEARGSFEEEVADVIDRDLHARDRAIRLITALIESGVSEKAMGGLTAALKSLSAERGGEIEAMAVALTNGDVGSRSEDEVEEAIEDAVEDQASAAERLQALLDGDQVPEQGKRGLAIALAAVNGERVEVAQTLEGLGDRMPAAVRAQVNTILQDVRDQTGAPIPTLGDAPTGDTPTAALPIPQGLPIPGGLPIPR